MTDFYFIRHGQTKANALGLKQGTINTELTYLNEVGEQQAQHLHDNFDISFADRVIVSPLTRTKRTAEVLNQTAQLPVTEDIRLLEISYGDWDGQKNADLEADHGEVFDPVLHDVLPTYVDLTENGESFKHVEERADAVMQDYAKQDPDGKFIVVTHGFTVKAAVLAALKPESVMALPEPENTSLTKISLIDGRYYVWYYNRVK
ncbi:histidine phosphatase family protein [Secundilactobacillus similis]|jgi:probable phosphoglycerate mutase|uniref:Phosphoglycerate mutase n=1 Tax=Secundilactobacillus similis DSM 23365 = JCM 2765 TaxID=1423804 RepID=A0A0R2F630_9LACO|nr:histidine phosphatase family protein [Secundilactobacillus similis]KRN20004.1 phosphoglycerate mutase [Secundilactobacillus similis DSM 23365 = JCM 2765]